MDGHPLRSQRLVAALATFLPCLASGLLPEVEAAGKPPKPVTLRLMTYNAWVGGTQVSDGYLKTLSAIADSGADIVGLQESEGRLATALALDLGWFAHQGPGSVAVLSRFPISELFPTTFGDAGLGARIRVSSGPAQDVIVFVCHLDAYPYGPYSACLDGLNASQVLADETQSGRVQQISDVLSEMGPFLADADSVPVFLLGDFNSPSHLDWTPAAASLHCGYTIEWPVTRRVEDAGLVDSFRESHPDPVAEPGNTWSPIFESFTYPDGAPEPLDRIDMVHSAGAGVATIGSEVLVVQPLGQYPDHQENEWPSDHAAVVSTFRVLLGGGVDAPLPALSLDRTTYASGETIVASFADGPGNATDWIGIYPESASPGSPSSQAWAWSYTNNTQAAPGISGPTAGQVTFDGSSAPVWPLPGGSYRAYFFCCDGYTVLAGPVSFEVSGDPGGPPPPALTLDKASYRSGETIIASFANGPGNATDWIGLYRTSDTPGAQPSQTWFYTNNRQRANGPSGPTQGQIVFDGRSGPVWPLPAGDYRAFFLCCDGYAILAGPVAFTIAP